MQIKSEGKVVIHVNDGRKTEYDIITQEMLRLVEDPPIETWWSLVGEWTSYNTNWKDMRAARHQIPRNASVRPLRMYFQ